MVEITTNQEKKILVSAPFTEKDPLFDSVKARLETQPSKKEKIRSLFSTKLAAVKDQVIGVRSEDILTIIERLQEGRIPVNFPGEGIRARKKGWYYLTPIETNPFWSTIPGVEFDGGNQSNIYEQTLDNIGLYAHSGAVATALSRNVFPHLQGAYRKEFRRLFKEIPGDIGMSTAESIASDLIDEWKAGGGKHVGTERIMRSPNRFPVFNCLLTLVHKEESRIPIGEFLIKVIKERGGVIVGFTKEVIQGRIASRLFDQESVIHATEEIAVKLKGGFIDLSKNPIIAIEPLGEYEDRILDQLGLGKVRRYDFSH